MFTKGMTPSRKIKVDTNSWSNLQGTRDVHLETQKDTPRYVPQLKCAINLQKRWLLYQHVPTMQPNLASKEMPFSNYAKTRKAGLDDPSKFLLTPTIHLKSNERTFIREMLQCESVHMEINQLQMQITSTIHVHQKIHLTSKMELFHKVASKQVIPLINGI